MTKLHFEDLTQITCPFGMLDDDTQQRLRACDEVEFFHKQWTSITGPYFAYYTTYRAKPNPQRLVTWVQWDIYDGEAVCCENLNEAIQCLRNYGGYIYRIERDEDGSNPTIELVKTGGKDE